MGSGDIALCANAERGGGSWVEPCTSSNRPNVIDGDHSLVGEGLDDFDLARGEKRRGFRSREHDRATMA